MAKKTGKKAPTPAPSAARNTDPPSIADLTAALRQACEAVDAYSADYLTAVANTNAARQAYNTAMNAVANNMTVANVEAFLAAAGALNTAEEAEATANISVRLAHAALANAWEALESAMRDLIGQRG